MELQTLNECAYECTRQSRWKETTQRYLSNLLVKNLELQEQVLNGTYRVSPTVDFALNDSMNPDVENGLEKYRKSMKGIFEKVLASGKYI